MLQLSFVTFECKLRVDKDLLIAIYDRYKICMCFLVLQYYSSFFIALSCNFIRILHFQLNHIYFDL